MGNARESADLRFGRAAHRTLPGYGCDEFVFSEHVVGDPGDLHGGNLRGSVHDGESTDYAACGLNRVLTVLLPETKKSRIKGLWIGLVTDFLIFLNATRYAHKLPYQIFVIGCLLNATILTVFVLALRRAYRDRT